MKNSTEASLSGMFHATVFGENEANYRCLSERFLGQGKSGIDF